MKLVKTLFLVTLLTSSLFAIDAKLSGFATIGGAISNQDYIYQKYIDDKGTLKKDSLAGAQLDLHLADEWSATFQAKVAQSLKDDDNFAVTLNWGFLSYRPSNDWLFRAGKVRIPFYLNSQNEDIGVTYDMARLPSEVYALSPYDNGLGGIITKTFNFEDATLSVDLFYIEMDYDYRAFIPYDKAYFGTKTVDLGGAAFNYETDEGNRIRGGFYKTILDGDDIDIVTLGLEYPFAEGYKLVSEYAALDIEGTETVPDYQAIYVALFKKIESWTPYISIGALFPEEQGEYSYTLGTSYAITALQKLKVEVTHVDTGSNPTTFIDITANETMQKKSLNLYSLSYNIAF